MTSNRDRAAEIIAPWIEKEWGHPEDNAESAADALASAGLIAPGDQFRAARGVLTEWWLNLDQTSDPRASAVGAVIDMMDDQMETPSQHVCKTLEGGTGHHHEGAPQSIHHPTRRTMCHAAPDSDAHTHNPTQTN